MRTRQSGGVGPLLGTCWLLALLGLLVPGGSPLAAIPEPDAILWGEITTPAGFPLPDTQTVQVVHQASGDVLATYQHDFSSQTEYSVVLQVRMVDLSDETDRPADAAEVNDWVEVRIPGQTLFSSRLNERGYIEHFAYTDLVLADTDGDLIPDVYESGTGVFHSLVDTGSDSNDEDTDDDGVWDGIEVLANSDPNDALEFPLPAGSGDVNQDETVNLADVLILQRVLRGETGLDYDFGAADIAPMGAPDGELTVADLLILIRVIRGEIPVQQ